MFADLIVLKGDIYFNVLFSNLKQYPVAMPYMGLYRLPHSGSNIINCNTVIVLGEYEIRRRRGKQVFKF